MPTIEEIVEASKGSYIPYEIIEYHGVKLLTTRAKVRQLIHVTWELTQDPAVKKLAEELGIELRKCRRL